MHGCTIVKEALRVVTGKPLGLYHSTRPRAQALDQPTPAQPPDLIVALLGSLEHLGQRQVPHHARRRYSASFFAIIRAAS